MNAWLVWQRQPTRNLEHKSGFEKGRVLAFFLKVLLIRISQISQFLNHSLQLIIFSHNNHHHHNVNV